MKIYATADVLVTVMNGLHWKTDKQTASLI